MPSSGARAGTSSLTRVTRRLHSELDSFERAGEAGRKVRGSEQQRAVRVESHHPEYQRIFGWPYDRPHDSDIGSQREARPAMKVWLDDRRPPRPRPEEWVWVKTPAEAIEFLREGDVTVLSLDHDLGLLDGERELTGYDVVLWIEEAVATQGLVPPETIRVHSSNASAAPKMERGIEAIRRLGSRVSERDRASERDL